MMKVREHLQVNNEDKEESDDEEKDLVTQDEFVSTCKQCGHEINGYFRYYYKCIDDSCEYPLHKFCAELPKTLKHTSHPRPITLIRHPVFIACYYCQRYGNTDGASWYICFDPCNYIMHASCGIEVEKTRIHHPSHPHPLVFLISKPILCGCNACGKEHKGFFFQCSTCYNFTIHKDCAFLTKSLLIQHTTNDTFHHTHPLTLSYSFPLAEQKAKHFPRCRVCNASFNWQDNLWIYKCEKCIYYTHLDCATSRREPFMSVLSIGKGPTFKNFKDADYRNLLQLPFPDQTYNIPKHLFFKEIGPTTYKLSLKHINHHHELILVVTNSITPTSSKIVCYNPMKKIELLCNGCLRPIMEMPFYKCGASEDEDCNFVLHEWCTRLPTKVENHPGHPQHPLILMSNIVCEFYNLFLCAVCCLPCNGYGYGCVECGYYVDVSCGFIPEKITHKSHPNHLLSIVKEMPPHSQCLMCLFPNLHPPFRVSNSRKRMVFNCSMCDVYIHPECALLLPETIRHSYDKHPMHLSYLPIENHKSEYFCEICECELNPHSCFYHCKVCVQSVHSTCAPLILCCETETYSLYRDKIYRFINVKFGSIHKTDHHPHPLSFVQGILNDGKCNTCGEGLQYNMILKCLECQFAIHALKTQCRSGLSSLLPPYDF